MESRRVGAGRNWNRSSTGLPIPEQNRRIPKMDWPRRLTIGWTTKARTQSLYRKEKGLINNLKQAHWSRQIEMVGLFKFYNDPTNGLGLNTRRNQFLCK